MKSSQWTELIYLNLSQKEPLWRDQIPGGLLQQMRSPEELQSFLHHYAKSEREILVMIQIPFLNEQVLRSFLKWGQSKLRISFIFLVQAIENAAYQMSLSHSKVLFFYESETRARLKELLKRYGAGLALRSRKQERAPVQAPVMLKKSVYAEHSPTGKGVQFLREGRIHDFSQGGARVAVIQGRVQEKDLISLMYQNNQGRWVSVESQVRWVVSTTGGEQIIGVQFLAVSA
ncbi:MAG: PilZ domain-containing protein [Bdellovibrio sp.]